MLIINALTYGEDVPVNCATCIVTNRLKSTTEASFKADWNKALKLVKKSDPDEVDFDTIADIMDDKYGWGILTVPSIDVWID